MSVSSQGCSGGFVSASEAAGGPSGLNRSEPGGAGKNKQVKKQKEEINTKIAFQCFWIYYNKNVYLTVFDFLFLINKIFLLICLSGEQNKQLSEQNKQAKLKRSAPEVILLDSSKSKIKP